MKINAKIMLLVAGGLVLTSVVIGFLAVWQLNRSGKIAVARIEQMGAEYLEKIKADGQRQIDVSRAEMVARKKEYLKSQVQTAIGVLEKAHKDAYDPEKLKAVYRDRCKLPSTQPIVSSLPLKKKITLA